MTGPDGEQSKYSSTEQLVLDVLAARTHLGESLWTFMRHSSVVKALQSLETRGDVTLLHGVVERTVRARLTDQGRKVCMSPDYVPPLVEQARRDALNEVLHMPLGYVIQHAAAATRIKKDETWADS